MRASPVAVLSIATGEGTSTQGKLSEAIVSEATRAGADRERETERDRKRERELVKIYKSTKSRRGMQWLSN